jgi:aspartate 1-decarboxylase
MHLQLVKSKIHRAEVTDCSLNYEGSLAIDRAWMDEANLKAYEKILVGNITNGSRFETYVIPAPAGSGKISLNGGTAHLGNVGDLLTIMAFAWADETEAETWKPTVIVLGEHNQKIIKKTQK